MTEAEFWNKAREVGAKATWAYLATAIGDQPKVRVVHPAIEGRRVWVATGRNSAKARQIGKNPRVELFYQIGSEMVHLTIAGARGSSRIPSRKSEFGKVRFLTMSWDSSGCRALAQRFRVDAD